MRKTTKKDCEAKEAQKECQSSIWAFKLDQTHSWAYANGVFSPEECKKIIELGEKLDPKPGLIEADSIKNTKVRDSKIAWMYPTEETQWIYYRLTQVIMDLNAQFFNFDLFGFTEGLQFTKYEAPSGHYHEHIDKLFGKTIRKLSVVLQLSDPEEFKGGDLNLTLGKEPDVMEKMQGKVVVFPSYVLHGVTPVTKGTRYSLVGWITGEPFK